MAAHNPKERHLKNLRRLALLCGVLAVGPLFAASEAAAAPWNTLAAAAACVLIAAALGLGFWARWLELRPPQEVERRFWVDVTRLPASLGEPDAIAQWYLASSAEQTVRVRRHGDGRGVLTVKGEATVVRGARSCSEQEIALAPQSVAQMTAGPYPCVRKRRYGIEFAGRLWELDIFEEENAGLILAEVELERAGAAVELPPWVGAEVTERPELSNAALARKPWTTWSQGDKDALFH